MREIKFRCWCVDAGYWDNQMLETRSIKLITVCNTHILQQYTGMKDKNGKEIYEGDIVKHSDTEELCQIIFENESASFIAITSDQYGETGYGVNNTIEIIGNIFENPELLK